MSLRSSFAVSLIVPVPAALGLLGPSRDVLRRSLDGLTEAQLLTVPDGHRNHLFWNVGHLVVTQQILTYRLSGLPLNVSDDLVTHFAKGTSPLDWTTTPDVDEVFRLFDALPAQTVADYEAGRFETFTPYQTATGPFLATFDDLLAFNLFHEGLHAGIVSAMRRLVV